MAGDIQRQLVNITADSITLEGNLSFHLKARGIIIFAHGTGSSRKSPRNQFVARILQRERFATLLFDLLTTEEDQVYEARFDIKLLTRRLIAVTHWLGARAHLRRLRVGYFGASTGAAAALKAAAKLKREISAVVSRGGRPDLAGDDDLSKVLTPTLLIVGGNDREVIGLNRQAFEKLKAPKRLEIVPGAGHLFEEKGVLEEVARLAAGWFKKYL